MFSTRGDTGWEEREEKGEDPGNMTRREEEEQVTHARKKKGSPAYFYSKVLSCKGATNRVRGSDSRAAKDGRGWAGQCVCACPTVPTRPGGGKDERLTDKAGGKSFHESHDKERLPAPVSHEENACATGRCGCGCGYG